MVHSQNKKDEKAIDKRRKRHYTYKAVSNRAMKNIKIKKRNSLTTQGNDDTIEKLLKRSGGHRKENSTIKPVDFG